MEKNISGNIVDIVKNKIFPGRIYFSQGRIIRIEKTNVNFDSYLIPGFVDAHVHIESSMLTPAAFAQEAIGHGTIAVVSDPHEIANVCGVEGIEYMVKSGRKTPLKFYFGAPSCVPATPYERSGATLTSGDLESLFKSGLTCFLSEMMNYPGVIEDNREVMAKIDIARKYNLKIDGHAPGLTGRDLRKYIGAGITTDHEVSSLVEAYEKIALGMKIQIREGSAARNFEALHTLIDTHPDDVMFCCDDIHPDDLRDGHINRLVRRAMDKGHNLFSVLRTASMNPIKHYGLDVGLIQVGDRADMIRVNSIEEFRVMESYINGEQVFNTGVAGFDLTLEPGPNRFVASEVTPEDLVVRGGIKSIRVIEAIDGDLYTGEGSFAVDKSTETIESNTNKDVLKIVVVNRYENTPPQAAFIRGFGLREGAIGSSVAHDSHNIIAVGADDHSLALAINGIIKMRGGLSAVAKRGNVMLPLPIAGLMSDAPAKKTAATYKALNQFAHDLGSTLTAPFMTLSFMSLLVIPKLKLGDRGLFDVEKFSFTTLADY